MNDDDEWLDSVEYEAHWDIENSASYQAQRSSTALWYVENFPNTHGNRSLAVAAFAAEAASCAADGYE